MIRSAVTPARIIAERHAAPAGPASVRLRPTSDRLRKSDLLPGDILLTRIADDAPPLAHSITAIMQRLYDLHPSQKTGGDPDNVHALLWTRAAGSTSAETAEARAGAAPGVVAVPLRKGTHEVYRSHDRRVAKAASVIALRWASARVIRYNRMRAVRSVTRPAVYCAHARAAARRYFLERNETRPAWAAQGTFCSEFVVAAYQAAAFTARPELPAGMRVHAHFITPRTLQHYLQARGSGFSRVGTITA